ncbi:MAG: YbdD/YjiX family protein [Gemmatimonadales bacterium]
MSRSPAARRLVDAAARPLGGPPEGWSQAPSGLWLQLREKAIACVSTFRQVAGMPDYEGYLRHLRLTHPDWPLPSEREFYALYVTARYGDGPTRCC